MITFPLLIEPQEQGVLLSFPDLPEAELIAADKADALRCALPLLESWLEAYRDQGRPFPQPRPRPGQLLVSTTRFSCDGPTQVQGNRRTVSGDGA